ncbi:sensor histidine kinase [Umezawaea tangerina]|uniref:sensor histidine kinase n=1 Tax=Umezawaea tangerina TaxID=84725 RepID=UPI000A400C95|nr:histidine kinase [Umezawaea tangerina]
MGALSLVELLHVLSLDPGITRSAFLIADTAVLAVAQVCYFSNPSARRGFPFGHLALALQAVLVALPVLAVGHTWIGVPGLLAGSVLLVLPRAAGWSAFTAVVAAATWARFAAEHDVSDAATCAVATAMTGLVTHGMPWLAAVAVKVSATRGDLARAAVAEERVRVSRDLHDLLGYGLSAIKLKSELTHRLLPEHPDRARESLAEIVDITHRTLVDVRSVALGYRLLSVEEAFRSADAVLRSAGIDVAMELHTDPIPEPAATVLATVLREGVTNVLRHSEAGRCEITLCRKEDAVELRIVNDGMRDTPQDHHTGSGVRNMTERVLEIGGSFSSHRDDDVFRLLASVPLAPRD